MSGESILDVVAFQVKGNISVQNLYYPKISFSKIYIARFSSVGYARFNSDLLTLIRRFYLRYHSALHGRGRLGDF